MQVLPPAYGHGVKAVSMVVQMKPERDRCFCLALSLKYDMRRVESTTEGISVVQEFDEVQDALEELCVVPFRIAAIFRPW